MLRKRFQASLTFINQFELTAIKLRKCVIEVYITDILL